ncbi:MAG: CPBP family intramembrane glutamic endopeptidase [Chitinophagaceae bacterium]
MTPIAKELLSTILQLIVFSFIPFIFFLLRKHKRVSFSNYIGLYHPTKKSIVFATLTSLLFVIGAIGMAFMDEGIKQILLSPKSVTGKLRLIGFSVPPVIILLIIALIKTSLSEEILFRGLLAKQMNIKFGFGKGNILQAAFFGAVHLLLFWVLTKSSLLPLIFIFVFSSFAGWTIGYIKEKYANGSIIPGWIAHGLGNALSYFIIAFLL